MPTAQSLITLTEAQLAGYTATTSNEAKALQAANAINNTTNNIYSQFDLTYNNAYDKLKTSTIANEQSYNFGTRTNDLINIQGDILDSVKNQVNMHEQNNLLAKRQYEINEWANSDKLDTLFVFQFVFLSLMFMALLGYLWKKDILPSGFLYFIGFVVLVINIMVIVMRSKYTRLLRNTRYWNKRKFNQYEVTPTTVPTCEEIGNAINNFGTDLTSQAASAFYSS